MAQQGAKRIICAGTGHDAFGSVASIQERVTAFNRANALAKAAGCQFGLHNHWWEFTNVDGRSGFDVMLDLGLDDDVFFEIDTYWVQTAWLDAPSTVAKYSHRTPLLHIKDGPTGVASDMTAVGAGVMDVKGVIEAGSNAEWLVVELDRCASDMLTAVKESIDYLDSNGLGHKRQA
ncbi:MAG: TIM barrel protein [Chloroflexota bacterium]